MYNGKSRYICRKYNTIKHLFSNKIIIINYAR